MNNIKQSMISWFAFSITALSTFLAYWAFMNMTEVTSSDTLTATWWNNMISNINDLNNRVNNQPNIPTWAVMAFNLTSCPIWWKKANWQNWTIDLRWEFIRWWDDGKWIDTWRNLWSTQEQDWKSFSLTTTCSGCSSWYSHVDVYMWKSTTSYIWNLFTWYWSNPSANIWTKWDTSEIRPRNVALLYCIKD